MRPNHDLAEQREENLPPCDKLSPNNPDAASRAMLSWSSEQIQPGTLRIGVASGSGSGRLPAPEQARLEALIGSWNGTLVVQGPLCGVVLEIAPACAGIERIALLEMPAGDFLAPEGKGCLILNPLGGDGEPLDLLEAIERFGQDDPAIELRVEVAPEGAQTELDRWLAAPTAKPAGEADDEKLALDGGRPVWEGPFISGHLGSALTSFAALRRLKEAVASRSLFRHYGLGTPRLVKEAEALMRTRFGRRHALALSSCSGALNTALVALGIGPGDEVILPAFVWYSDYNAVVLSGATPVFCDIDPGLNLCPVDFARKITGRTKAVIVVHYQGAPAQMEEICSLGRQHHVAVIEDCAQALGATYQDRPVGSFGDIAVFSFQANKVLASGEGGALLCDEDKIFARAVRYHDLGLCRPLFAAEINETIDRDKGATLPGNQYRMSEATAAVLLAQFGRLDWMVARCRMLHRLIVGRIRSALPDAQFRQSGCNEGDIGITVFLDCGAGSKAQEFAKALNAEGIYSKPSSGTFNLLTLDYVIDRAMNHPALPPFGPGQPGEHVRYSLSDAPMVAEYSGRMVPVTLGPLLTVREAETIARAFIKVGRALGCRPSE
ncbi:MAG: aminotransferase class I/II-fold pyridoxal phosphate-dependent enzyme [Verrucomicrobiota bacterium]